MNRKIVGVDIRFDEAEPPGCWEEPWIVCAPRGWPGGTFCTRSR